MIQFLNRFFSQICFDQNGKKRHKNSGCQDTESKNKKYCKKTKSNKVCNIQNNDNKNNQFKKKIRNFKDLIDEIFVKIK